MSYQVFIDDNFHYMDPEHRQTSLEFETFEEAVKYCESIVDDFLIHTYRPGMPPYELLTQYIMFGEDPFVKGGSQDERFSSRDYVLTWIKAVYGEWPVKICDRDRPLFSRLIAMLLTPLVKWRIRRRRFAT